MSDEREPRCERPTEPPEVVACLADMDVHAADAGAHASYVHVKVICPPDEMLDGVEAMHAGFERGMFLLMTYHDGRCNSPDDNPLGPCSNCRQGNRSYWEPCPTWPGVSPPSSTSPPCFLLPTPKAV